MLTCQLFQREEISFPAILSQSISLSVVIVNNMTSYAMPRAQNSWGLNERLSIENVQEFENSATTYLDDKTSYDFQDKKSN